MSKISFLLASDAAELSNERKALHEEASIRLTRKFLGDALTKAINNGRRSVKISFFDMVKEADSISKTEFWKQICSVVPDLITELRKLGYTVEPDMGAEHIYTVIW